MNKVEIKAILSDFPYETDEYWIITGSAMVLYGIREETSDIDMGCTSDMADKLEAEGYLDHRSADGKRCFKYGKSIEIFEDWLRDSVGTIDGLPVISIKGLIEMKQELGREKDKRDIELIRRYLLSCH